MLFLISSCKDKVVGNRITSSDPYNAKINIISNVNGASVKVNGEYKGKTDKDGLFPIELQNLPADKITKLNILITDEIYQDYNAKVSITKGNPNLELNAYLIKNYGRVKFENLISFPKANVSLNKIPLGSFKKDLEGFYYLPIKKGYYQIYNLEIKKPYYKDKKIKIVSLSENDLTINKIYFLEPDPNYVKKINIIDDTNTWEGADLSIDDYTNDWKFSFTIPFTIHMAPGEYNIKLLKEGNEYKKDFIINAEKHNPNEILEEKIILCRIQGTC